MLDISVLIRNDPNQLLAVYDCDPILARQIAEKWTAEDPAISARCLYVADRVIATDNTLRTFRELGSAALRRAFGETELSLEAAGVTIDGTDEANHEYEQSAPGENLSY